MIKKYQIFNTLNVNFNFKAIKKGYLINIDTKIV